MNDILQILSSLKSNEIDGSIALDKLQQQLKLGNIQQEQLIRHLQELKNDQTISASLHEQFLQKISLSSAETVVVKQEPSILTSSISKKVATDDADLTRLNNDTTVFIQQTQIVSNAKPNHTVVDLADDKTKFITANNADDLGTDMDQTIIAHAADFVNPTNVSANSSVISIDHSDIVPENSEIQETDELRTRLAQPDTHRSNSLVLNEQQRTEHEATNQKGPISEKTGPQKLQPGSVIKDRFILKSVVGAGGMSVVFRALDLRKQEARNSNPYVAIKVLGDSFRHHPLSLLALERETQKIQSLAHPNIVTVYDFDRDGDNIYMTMECLDGQSLDGVIRDHKQGMAFTEAQSLISGMCQALIYAHSKNIIHSDFKPENVFYTKAKTAKVLDFGIARAQKFPDRKQPDTIFDAGSLSALTPPYASLEMLQDKDPDPRDDIYALGCVVYKILTGSHPYKNLQADLALTAELHPARINSLNRRQWQTLLGALALRRENRIKSVHEFLNGIIPKKTPLWVYGLSVSVILAIGVSGYLGTSITEQNALPKVVLSKEQKIEVNNYLEIADLYYSLGYLATPPGDSALDQYEKVLAIDPTNRLAIKGKKKLVKRYLKMAELRFELGETEESLQLIETALLIDPINEKLLNTRDRYRGPQGK